MSAYFDKKLILQHPLAVIEKGRRASMFNLNPKGELELKNYQPSSGWSELQTISEGLSCFTAAYGINQNLYIVEIYKEGIFNLKKRTGLKWEDSNFFKEEKDKQVSHLQLLSDYQGRLHLIYLLSSLNGEQWWLIHHYFASGKWDEPRVIDFGGEGNSNYGHAFIDINNTLHIVYHIKERNRIPLYHRTFSMQDSGWSRAEFLTADQNNFSPLLFEGPDLNLHLAWCASHEDGYLIRHKKKVQVGWPVGEKWTPATDISPASKVKLFPFIGFDEDILKIKWLSSGYTYQRLSNDGGKQWKNIQKTEHTNKVQLFRIISNSAWDDIPRLQWTTTWDDPDSPLELSVQKYLEKNETEIMPHLKELKQYSTNLFPPTSGYKAPPDRQQPVRSSRYHSSSNAPKVHYAKEQNARQTEEKFNHTLETIKQKYQLSRQVWEEENLKLLKTNQQLKQEKTRLEQKLDKKDKELKKLQHQVKKNGAKE